MSSEILLRYLHFVSIFAIVSVVVAEHLLIKPQMSRKELKRMAIIDRIYGIAVVIVLIAGMSLWFSDIGKPVTFYSKNWIFHLKLTLFVIVGLFSIYPTVFFIKHRKGNPEESVTVPKIIVWCLRIELLLLFIMPLLAGLMAKGVGFFGA